MASNLSEVLRLAVQIIIGCLAPLWGRLIDRSAIKGWCAFDINKYRMDIFKYGEARFQRTGVW